MAATPPRSARRGRPRTPSAPGRSGREVAAARRGNRSDWGRLHPPALSACVVCGPDHPTGLRIRFRRVGETVVGTFTPAREHQGYHGLMSGGLVAAIFDCLHYRVPAAAGVLSAVTARLEVQYRAPIRVGRRVRFEARLVEHRGRVWETRAVARLGDGVVAAESSAVYVEIPADRLPPLPR